MSYLSHVCLLCAGTEDIHGVGDGDADPRTRWGRRAAAGSIDPVTLCGGCLDGRDWRSFLAWLKGDDSMAPQVHRTLTLLALELWAAS